MFDTIGTLIGVSTKAGMLDEEGHLPNIKGALMLMRLQQPSEQFLEQQRLPRSWKVHQAYLKEEEPG